MRVRPREPVRSQSARRAPHHCRGGGEAVGVAGRNASPTGETRMQLGVQSRSEATLAVATPLPSPPWPPRLLISSTGSVLFSDPDDIFRSNAEACT